MLVLQLLLLEHQFVMNRVLDIVKVVVVDETTQLQRNSILILSEKLSKSLQKIRGR